MSHKKLLLLLATMIPLLLITLQWNQVSAGGSYSTPTKTPTSTPTTSGCAIDCYRVKLVSSVDNGNGTTTLTWEITVNCDNGLSHVSFQLPGGVPATAPAHNSVYTSPSGRQYSVQNPTNNPFYAIKFNAIGSGIKNGQSDTFTYTIAGSFDENASMKIEMKAGTNSRTLTFVPSSCQTLPTPTNTPTNTPTSTPTDTPTNTPTSTPTDTPTNTPTETPTNTPTPTDTPTNTPTDTPTETPTNTPTDTPTNTPTSTPTDTPTNTPTETPTNTPTPTDTPTETPTNTPTDTPTETPTNTPTPTDTPTETPTNTPTDTPTKTPTDTPEPTFTPTDTPTDTPTSTPVSTEPPQEVATPTNTPEPPTPTPTEVPLLAAIGDRVWFDLNANGIQEEGENGVPGVTVYLLDVGGAPIANTTTDSQGLYLFSGLQSGVYAIQFMPPPGYRLSPQDQGDDDAADSDADPVFGKTIQTTLEGGETDLTWDAGIYLPAAIGDYVWDDTNNNGLQEGGEPPVPGVTVRLYTAQDQLTASMQTDSSGRYFFGDLTPGDYYLVFDPTTLPTDYHFVNKNLGSDPAIDSDADVLTGVTAVTTLVAGEVDLTWDAGVFKSPGGDNPTDLEEGDEPPTGGMQPRLWLPLVAN